MGQGLTRRLMLQAAAGLAAAASAPIAVAQEASGGPPRPLKLILDWYLNPNHAPLLIAQARGAFEARGLAVELIEPADPNDPPKLVAAGQADIAISYQPQLMLQVDAGLPLKRIGALIPSPLNMLLTLGDGPVKSIADLKGRKVGNSVGGFEDALLAAMLSKHGLSLTDVEIVNVNFALAQSLMSGGVDAVIGAYRNYELNVLAIEGKAARGFYVEEEGVPGYDELVFVAESSKAGDPAMAAFIEAVEDGVTFVLNHPEEAWRLFVDGRPQLDDELNRRAFADTLRRFAHAPGAADPARYDRFAAFLKAQGLIAEARPAAAYLASR